MRRSKELIKQASEILAVSYSDDPKWLTAKYPGRDAKGNPFNKGDKVLYYPRTKKFLVGKEAEKAWMEFEASKFDEDMYHRASQNKEAGAEEFYNLVWIADVKQAFNNVVSGAKHSYGHEGYTGTIAEKGNYKVRSNNPMSPREAEEFADKDLRNTDKWGPAFAVPVSRGSDKGVEKIVKLKVKAKDIQSARMQADSDINAKFAKPGLNVETTLVKHPTQLTQNSKPEFKFEKLAPKDSFRYSGYPEKGTKEQAMEDAIRNMGSYPDGHTEIIYKITPILKVTKVSDGKKIATWEVEMKVKISKASGKIDGWLFYGMASS
jgi:hypothetical protein